MGKILVAGGCGYIGSHTIIDLLEHGYEVISVDNLVNSSEDSLDQIKAVTGKEVKNYQVDLVDFDATKKVFEDNPDITGVIHFAALKAVGESCQKPFLYFKNNLNSLLNILECAHQAKVKNFIFSSSCTVYGNAEELPVSEQTPQKDAESPYGRTKQMGEKILQDCLINLNSPTRCVSLRYFNPAGAHPSAKIGESPINPPQNLVPIITETALGKRKGMSVYGSDYDTRDGTCIRDYIHIMDLANAHTKAVQYLEKTENAPQFDMFNLGIGDGVSVLEAINAFEKVSGKKLNYEMGDRREGDVIAIYANYEKAKATLGWNPQYNIEDIMDSAWRWEQAR